MISKNEFEEVYRKFPPTTFEKVFIKYTDPSRNVSKKSKLAIIICFILMIPLLVRLLFEAHILPVVSIHIMGYFYSFLLAIIGIIWCAVWKLRRNRYKKVQKELNISEEEFYKIIRAYYSNYYENSIDFVKYNTKTNKD